MSDYNERACTRCGSYLHHEDDCNKIQSTELTKQTVYLLISDSWIKEELLEMFPYYLSRLPDRYIFTPEELEAYRKGVASEAAANAWDACERHFMYYGDRNNEEYIKDKAQYLQSLTQ